MIVMRPIMIGLGATLVSQFSWVLYIFGAFLVITGIKMWISAEHTPDMKNNVLLAWLRRHLRVTERLHGNAFVVTQPHPATGKPVRWVTPLFLALCMVELIDLVFAGSVLCPHRDDSPLQVSEVRAGLGAGFHRHKNFAARRHRQNATSDFAWRDLWADCWRRDCVALQNPQ